MGLLTVHVAPFSSQAPYELKIDGETFTAKDAQQVKTLWADDFRPVEENGIRYRLYEPAGEGARPLILFLHGGGRGRHRQLEAAGGLLRPHLPG